MTVVVRALLALVAGLALAVGGTGCAELTAGIGGSAPTETSVTVVDPPSGIPPHVLDTLALIDAGDWPDAADAPGTQGGERFGNREQLLPHTDGDGRRIRYQEWDVNPKERGQGRDAERIVTGDDGSAWYTADHYSSFDRIR